MSLYGALWRHLPGPLPVRLVVVGLLGIGVVAVCFRWVFPALAPSVPWNAGTVDAPAAAAPATPTTTSHP